MGKTNEYLTNNTSLGSITPVKMQERLQNYLYQLRKDAEQLSANVNRLVDQYQASASNDLDELNKHYNKQLRENQQALKTTLTTEQKSRATDLITKYEQQIAHFAENKTILVNSIEELKQNQAKAQSTIEDMRKFEKEDKVYAIVNLFNRLIDASTFEYTSELITAKTDEIKYTITIEPTELNTCGINGKKIIEVVTKVNKGLKIDFSTGIFLNSGSENFIGRTYYYENIDTESRKIVSADRGSRLLLSVGALMHFYKRSTHKVKVGGSLGVSTTAALSDLMVHVGPSLLISNKNRIVLSGGITLKTSSLLDQKLQLDTVYTNLKSPDDIPTVSVFPTAGAFFSLTYNFTKLPSK